MVSRTVLPKVLRTARSVVVLLAVLALAFVAVRVLDQLTGTSSEPSDAPTAAPTSSGPSTAPTPGGTPKPGSVAPGTATVAGGDKLTVTPRRGLELLTVVREDRQAYRRALFGDGWIDADGDCRDTRAEVLARDSQVPVAAGCRVFRGQWFSYYDGLTWKQSVDVQVDHLVPLAEAWDSGAFTWNAATRWSYANDLADRRALVPITTALNYAKVADDPSRYLPKVNRCRYVASWIAVKLRWRLSVDEREQAALEAAVAKCPATPLTVKRATRTLLPFAAGTGTQDRDVTIESIRYRGSERVVLRNGGSRAAVLDGWVLRDGIGYGQLRIPRTTLPAGRALTIMSAKGKDRTNADGGVVRFAAWGDVWNDTGDTAVLIDGRRQQTDSCTYRGDETGSARC